MKFSISDKVKQIIDKSEYYVFEKRTKDTWWLELMDIDSLIRILKNAKGILSIELIEYEYGDLLTIELFDDYKDMV